MEATQEFLQLLDEYNAAQVVVYCKRPMYTTNVFQVLSRRGTLSNVKGLLRPFLVRDVEQMKSRVKAAETFFAGYGVEYYSPIGFLCQGGSCDVLTDQRKLVYFDTGHFTFAGIEYLADNFLGFLTRQRLAP